MELAYLEIKVIYNNSWCYNNDPRNCEKYGRLYTWDAAMNGSTTEGAQGVCPSGWHIPTYNEYETLIESVNNDGNALKEIGQGIGYGVGRNTSGFSDLLVGYRSNNGHFYNVGTDTTFFGHRPI
ncbi:MAG: hypothetical protein K8F60_17395 [Melioribacteraceae bacterium]|nr:hypothetical protein [Melioribacteraceae bacterium]